MARRDRGEYRPIFEALWDGPDFQQLSPTSRFVLVTLKGKLGASGIKQLAAMEAQLHVWTGHPPKVVASALRTLEQAGWIERERDVVWVVRGFEFEPSWDATNTNQRKHIDRLISSLPSLAIVERFRSRYAEWFPGSLSATPSPTPFPTPFEGGGEGPSKGLRRGSVSNTPSPTPTPNSKAKAFDADVILPSPARDAPAEEITPSPSVDRAGWLDPLGELTPLQREPIQEFLVKVPNGQKWVARVRGWLAGQGTPGGKACTLDDVAVGLGEYLLGDRRDFTPAHVVGFVASARDRREAMPPPAPIARAEALVGLIFEHDLAHLRGQELREALEKAGGAESAQLAADLETLKPLKDITGQRTREASIRLAAQRLQRGVNRPALVAS